MISGWRIKKNLEENLQIKTMVAVLIPWFCLKNICMCFHLFLYSIQVDAVYQKILYNSCFLLFLRHVIQKTKEHILHKWGFIMFYSKKIISVLWIKSNWFDFIHYTEIIFLSKNVIFSYFKNIFYHVTLENIFEILNNFQNIMVCNEPLISSSSWR